MARLILVFALLLPCLAVHAGQTSESSSSFSSSDSDESSSVEVSSASDMDSDADGIEPYMRHKQSQVRLQGQVFKEEHAKLLKEAKEPPMDIMSMIFAWR